MPEGEAGSPRPSSRLPRELRAAQPGAPGGADPLEVGRGQAAQTAGDGRQETHGDEDPRLGARIALRRDRARGLAAGDHLGDERVDVTQVPAEVAPDLRIVA